jgi:uncharacterized protein
MQNRFFLHLIAIGSGWFAGCAPRATPDVPVPAVSSAEVEFHHGANVLSGTLYLPAGPGPHPALALVFGSGKQDRVCGGVGPALGDYFARHGFACLAWDKPGCGKSSGDFNEQTLRDRAEEALAAVRFLRGRDDIQANRVGLWGHSQGGTVIPFSASLSQDVAFLIAVAGWQGLAWQQDAARVEAEMRADHGAEDDIQNATAFARRRMDLIRGAGPFAELDNAQEAAKTQAWFGYVHRCDRTLFYSARRMVEHDSAPTWEKVRCPVLAIFGAKDTSTGPAEPLISIIQGGTAKANNRDVTVKIFPDADHALRRSETGSRREAAERDRNRAKEDGPDFVPGYLDTMTDWLTKRYGN